MTRAMISVTCNGCGKAFDTLKHKARRCCSAECFAHVLRVRNQARRTLKDVICKTCGKAFQVGRSSGRLCCSGECSRTSRAASISATAAANPRAEMQTRACKQCGSAFVEMRSIKRQMCSKACVEAHRVVISSRTIKKLHADPAFRKKLDAVNSQRMKDMWRDDEFRAACSQSSSDRMRARRNGGDPELNATLAKACGDHLKRMWEKQSFRDLHRELGTAKLAAYNVSDQRQLQDAELRKVMGQAARKLRTDPAFSEIMSRKSIEHRLADPYDPLRHGEYNPDYVSYICTRVQEDEEMRTFHDTRMSALLKEAWEQWWEERAA